ncbi:MAG: lipoyl domain-containing protein [Sulfolobales archaeon]|nr:lipoyl domain-containing protein [Sulfolobales archaeon]MDW7969810.1 lipoyl domain-containing protein [Sulfolobales archaeon]
MVEVIMPRMDPEMREGRIVEWLKNEGDEVKEGDVIARVEAEKVVFDLEAPKSGIIKKILANVGDVIPVGKAVAIIE